MFHTVEELEQMVHDLRQALESTLISKCEAACQEGQVIRFKTGVSREGEPRVECETSIIPWDLWEVDNNRVLECIKMIESGEWTVEEDEFAE